jgi:hypothetical protein
VSKQETLEQKKRQARNLLATRRSRERKEGATKDLEEANLILSNEIDNQKKYFKVLEERIRNLTDKDFYQGVFN